jgi:hypothetical protein
MKALAQRIARSIQEDRYLNAICVEEELDGWMCNNATPREIEEADLTLVARVKAMLATAHDAALATLGVGNDAALATKEFEASVDKGFRDCIETKAQV